MTEALLLIDVYSQMRENFSIVSSLLEPSRMPLKLESCTPKSMSYSSADLVDFSCLAPNSVYGISGTLRLGR